MFASRQPFQNKYILIGALVAFLILQVCSTDNLALQLSPKVFTITAQPVYLHLFLYWADTELLNEVGFTPYPPPSQSL